MVLPAGDFRCFIISLTFRDKNGNLSGPVQERKEHAALGLLKTFYQSYVASVLVRAVVCWWGGIKTGEVNRLTCWWGGPVPWLDWNWTVRRGSLRGGWRAKSKPSQITALSLSTTSCGRWAAHSSHAHHVTSGAPLIRLFNSGGVRHPTDHWLKLRTAWGCWKTVFGVHLRVIKVTRTLQRRINVHLSSTS